MLLFSVCEQVRCTMLGMPEQKIDSGIDIINIYANFHGPAGSLTSSVGCVNTWIRCSDKHVIFLVRAERVLMSLGNLTRDMCVCYPKDLQGVLNAEHVDRHARLSAGSIGAKRVHPAFKRGL
jgi:hypothetical protein